jgi:hypothetical protein
MDDLNDDFIERFRFQPETFEIHAEAKACDRSPKKAARRPRLEAFAICPLAAAALACKALGTFQMMVWLYLLYKVRLTGNSVVVLTNGPLAELGVDRKTKYRALINLEKAGLIAVKRGSRKAPRVTVLGTTNPCVF